MSTQELIVAVLLVLTLSSLVFAIGLIVGPRIRRRRSDVDELVVPVVRTGQAVGPGVLAPGGLDPGRPMPGGSASAFAGRTVAAASGPAEPARPLAADPVTGLDLAPAWSKWLAEEGARVDRYGRSATVVLVEVAGIDRLAERLGPEAVDRLIPPIATTMRRHARASDNVARIGQARFGALLPETDEIRAINYVERVAGGLRHLARVGRGRAPAVDRLGADRGQAAVEVAIQAAERRLNEERQRSDASDRTWCPDAAPEPVGLGAT